MTNEWHIVWKPEDEIDGFTFSFIERVFGREVSEKNVFVSQEEELGFFLENGRGLWSIDMEGHEQILFSQVPPEDKTLYIENPEYYQKNNIDFHVYYPPLSEDEERILMSRADALARSKVESAYGVTLDAFDGPLILGPVVKHVAGVLLDRLTNNPDLLDNTGI